MPKNLRRRGSVWYYRFFKDGREIEGSLETESLTVAKERLESVRRELTGRKFGEQPRRTFEDAARRFAAEHFKTLKPSSRRRYVTSLLQLEQHLAGMALQSIGSSVLGDYEQARLKEGLIPSTIRRDLACLSSVYSRAEEWEWVTSNPVKPFLRKRSKAGLKESKPRTRNLSLEEEAGVLATAPPRARIAIIFAIDTGLRKEEQFSLEWPDVDLEAAEIRVRAEVAKSGEERSVPILPRTMALLKSMTRGVGRVPVFVTGEGKRYSPQSPTMYEALQKACRRAGIPRCSWHDLRRTCGCRLLQEYGLSFDQVSKWLGHADVRITQQRYAFLRVSDLHKALDKSNVVYLKLNGQKRGE
jgi:integrase